MKPARNPERSQARTKRGSVGFAVFGADEPVENDDFVLPPNCGVEVTFRTHQQQFLLRPDAETNKIVLGCFGRAYARTPDLQLVAVSFLSNHGCMLALPKSLAALSNFMRDFASTTAVKLNELRDRTGTFWERRHRAISSTPQETGPACLRCAHCSAENLSKAGGGIAGKNMN